MPETPDPFVEIRAPLSAEDAQQFVDLVRKYAGEITGVLDMMEKFCRIGISLPGVATKILFCSREVAAEITSLIPDLPLEHFNGAILRTMAKAY